jgi:hypothetical protein
MPQVIVHDYTPRKEGQAPQMYWHQIHNQKESKNVHTICLPNVQNSKSTRNVLTFLYVPVRSPYFCQGLSSSSPQFAIAIYMSPKYHKDINVKIWQFCIEVLEGTHFEHKDDTFI